MLRKRIREIVKVEQREREILIGGRCKRLGDKKTDDKIVLKPRLVSKW